MKIGKNALIYAAAAICALCFSVLLTLYLNYEKQSKEQTRRAFFDYQIKQLHKNVEDTKLSAAAIAALLAQNGNIKGCFTQLSREQCLKNVDEIIHTLSMASMYKNIKIHLHTSDFKSYVRSWDKQNFGDTLSSFRYLISEAAERKTPVAGVEYGVAGIFVRAVSAISENGRTLGSVEVLLDYEHIANFFKEQGIDLYVLIDKNRSVSKKPGPSDALLKDYYVQNLSSANLNLIQILDEIDFKNSDFYTYKTHFICAVPLIDASNKRIGYYVLHVNSNEKERFLSQNYVAF